MKDFEISGKTLVKYQGAGGDVVIPDSVAEVASDAFRGCTALRSVTVPASVSYLGDAFRDCTGLVSVKIESRTKEVEVVGYAFQNGELVSVTLPPKTVTEGIGRISGYTFQNCKNLVSVTLPDTVTEIHRNAFEGCCSLAGIALPDSVKEICSEAFKGCSALREILLPDSVEKIHDGVFEDCRSLVSVTLGRRTDRILDDAFRGCSSLASVTLPSSVLYVSGSAFLDCPSLTRVYLEDPENWLRVRAEQGGLPYFEDAGATANVADPEAAARLLGELDGEVLVKKKEAYRYQPRFVALADASSEDAFMALGQCFAYVTPEPTAEERLLEQARHLFVRCEGVTHYDNDDETGCGTRRYLTSTPLSDLHSLKEPYSVSGYNGDLLVADGELQGVILYVGTHTVLNAYGECMIPLRRAFAEDEDAFTLLYTDGRVLGRGRRELGNHMGKKSEDTVETLSLTGEDGLL